MGGEFVVLYFPKDSPLKGDPSYREMIRTLPPVEHCTIAGSRSAFAEEYYILRLRGVELVRAKP